MDIFAGLKTVTICYNHCTTGLRFQSFFFCLSPMDLTEGTANREKIKLQLSKWPNCWVYLLIKEKGIKESSHHQLEGEMKRLCVCVSVSAS